LWGIIERSVSKAARFNVADKNLVANNIWSLRVIIHERLNEAS
jgi:hypothetical protein